MSEHPARESSANGEPGPTAPAAEPSGSLAGTPPSTRDLPPAAQMLVVDARTVVLIGTLAFTLVLVGLLPFWAWLGHHDHRVWLWTALSGAVLGLVGLVLIRKHSSEGRLG
ncbi:DUF2530 domain-containing protein [Jatrophihabitans telluris]|uniref:DUF2530 domain-containing protein n=1 Tax=Jatrophihabitans telluris TaxID=2038343 RepID=A0ABY4R253_9ACTN|nr:DUF2530 domain-containing protein [Jatrophihabitans telluris]UQX89124.1 DUF2530 domain-containing protein [Jatrophihabitans telluris]